MNIQTQSFVGTMYRNGGRILHVGPYEEKFRTIFYFLNDPSEEIFLGSLPKCDTPEIAQKMLDDYAVKHDYEVYEPTSGAEMPLESDLSSDDTPAEAAGEPEDNELATQLEQDDITDSENDEPDFNNNSDDSENDQDDNPPDSCDWKNASGVDEDEPAPSVPKDVIVGERVSLRNSEFEDILDAADTGLNGLIRTLREKNQHDGELNIKVIFEDYGTAFRFSGQISGKINYSLKPVKISLDENVEIKFDEFGNPVIPYNRQHQMNFDEIQPGRVIPPKPITTTVDGNPGLVEDVQVEDETDEDPDAQKTQQFSCDQEDCPFHGTCNDDDSSGCCFDTEDSDDSNFPGDIWTAVNMENCQRGAVLEAYRKNNPENDYDGSDEPDETYDLPFDMQDNFKEAIS
jgi:hypothetical protein